VAGGVLLALALASPGGMGLGDLLTELPGDPGRVMAHLEQADVAPLHRTLWWRISGTGSIPQPVQSRGGDQPVRSAGVADRVGLAGEWAGAPTSSHLLFLQNWRDRIAGPGCRGNR